MHVHSELRLPFEFTSWSELVDLNETATWVFNLNCSLEVNWPRRDPFERRDLNWCSDVNWSCRIQHHDLTSWSEITLKSGSSLRSRLTRLNISPRHANEYGRARRHATRTDDDARRHANTYERQCTRTCEHVRTTMHDDIWTRTGDDARRYANTYGQRCSLWLTWIEEERTWPVGLFFCYIMNIRSMKFSIQTMSTLWN